MIIARFRARKGRVEKLSNTVAGGKTWMSNESPPRLSVIPTGSPLRLTMTLCLAGLTWFAAITKLVTWEDWTRYVAESFREWEGGPSLSSTHS